MFPEVYREEEEVLCPINIDKFQEVVRRASAGKAQDRDGAALFHHYMRMEVLHLNIDERLSNFSGVRGSDVPADGNVPVDPPPKPIASLVNNFMRTVSSSSAGFLEVSTRGRHPVAYICQKCSSRVALSRNN
eukprot:scaffold319333_cov34-Prasinocladus_malaysianus.AAC.1